MLYTKRARLPAILWTLLIFFLCFLPAKDIPEVDVPLIDKWTHFTLFAVFSMLWLASVKRLQTSHYMMVFIAALVTGWFVEFVQGRLPMLGRSQDNMDILADAVGGIIGIVVYILIHRVYRKRMSGES